MTIIGVGKPTPSQLFLLQLAGIVIQGRSRVLEPTALQVQNSQRQGLQRLRELTGVDYGDDIQAWYDFLAQGDFGIHHSYGLSSMLRLLKQQGYDLVIS